MEFITLRPNVVLNWKLDGAISNHVYHLLNTSPPPPPPPPPGKLVISWATDKVQNGRAPLIRSRSFAIPLSWQALVDTEVGSHQFINELWNSSFIYQYSISIMNVPKCLFCPLLHAILVTTYHQIQIMSAPLEVVKGDI